jgi:hypothetical protein
MDPITMPAMKQAVRTLPDRGECDADIPMGARVANMAMVSDFVTATVDR